MTILKKLLLAAALAVFVVAVAIAVASFLVPAERSFANEIEISALADQAADRSIFALDDFARTGTVN